MTLMNKWKPVWQAEDETGAGEVSDSAETTEAETSEETPADKSLINKEDEGPVFGLDPVEADALEIPDDLSLSEEQTSQFLELVNSAESKADLANKMLGMYRDSVAQAGEALAEEFRTTMTAWQDEIKKDTAYGGEHLNQSLARSKEIALEFGGDEFLSLLDQTGTGNSIHMVRFLNKVYDAIPREPGSIKGSPAPSGEKSLADRLFSS